MTDKTPARPELPDGATVLPDGSAFAIASSPLPANHWLYAPREYRDGEEDPIELPSPILSHQAHGDVVRAAIRYAVRGATMCGKEPDFDPDALVQNAIYALCGPFGGAALQSAQPAAVSDGEIVKLAFEMCSACYSGMDHQFAGMSVVKFARAILALRPQAVPMTDREQTYIYPCSGCPTPGRCTDTSGCHEAAMGVPSYYVRHPDDTYTLAIPQPTLFGITAPAGGEKQA